MTSPGRAQTKQRAAGFFCANSYFSNAVRGTSLVGEKELEGAQNFLEVQFVKKILAPALNESGLLRARPQEQVGRYFIDFALCGTKKFALEIDGFGKFQNRAALDNFLKRQNDIAKAGWTIIRYSYSQIMHTTQATLRDFCAILKSDSELERLLNPDLTIDQTELFVGTEGACDGHMIDRVNDFHRAQDCFADFCATHRPNDVSLTVRDSLKPSCSFVAVAITALYEWLDAVSGVVDVDFDLPRVRICSPTQPPRLGPYLHAKVSIEAETGLWDLEINEATILYGAARIPVPPDADAQRIRYRQGLTLDEIHQRLTYFTENIFDYIDGTKAFQDRILKRIFDERNVLGISTTGSGKSFCFWLPSLLRPGLTIVVAPLRALMRDQILSLRTNGIGVADFINVDVPEASRQRIMAEARLGFIRILYVAPERLRIKKFVDQLAQLNRSVPIKLLAIDEAHCISEWGHDFRPSYLKLPWVCKRLSNGEFPLQLIALTATASLIVAADMLRVLQLKKGDGDEGDVIRDAAADRLRFSYQVVVAENSENKTGLFHKILTDHTPKSLRADSLTTLLKTVNKNHEKSLGIVFCIYANPHGRHSTREGTAHHLYETMSVVEPGEIFESGRRPRKYRLSAYSTGRVRAFSSTKPTLCPRCNSYDFTAGKETGQKLCGHCKHTFVDGEEISPKTWDKVIKENQEHFKARDFDILVATKGFGMGVDQPSVRFVVHTALSAGLESWYQEVGRAGRDNERAHIALLTEPPNSACMTVLMAREKKVPDCNSYISGCPHGKPGLCDYGKQHMFITRSYPGVVSDAFASLTMLDKIFAAQQAQPDGPVTVNSRHDRISSDEITIYRLAVLGLVRDDYVIAYEPHSHFVVNSNFPSIPDNQEDLTRFRKAMQKQLMNYLSPFHGERPARSKVSQEVEECLKEFGEPYNFPDKLGKLRVLNQCSPLFDQTESQFLPIVYGYLILLLKYTYEHVVTMRYDMLWNLLTVVRSQNSAGVPTCRRIPLLARLGSSIEESYRCGLCDVCSPNLVFPDSRNPLPGSSTDEELERQLESIFANDPDSFDLAVLRKLVYKFKDYPTAKYTQARTVVEGSPKNLSALFVAREFSPLEELAGNSRRLLRTANEARISFSCVEDLYTTSEDSLKEEMLLSILNSANSNCDTVEGWEFLVREVSRLSDGQAASAATMRECLAFFLVVAKILPREIPVIKNRVVELEKAFYA